MDLSRYIGLFVSESREHVASARDLAARLGCLRDDPATVRELLRHAHSLKGMAASMGFRTLSRLAHAVEDLLDAFRAGRLDPGLDHAALVTDALDCLETIAGTASRREAAEDPEVDELESRLRAAATQGRVETLAPGPDASGREGPPGDTGEARWRVEVVFREGISSPAVHAALVLGRLRRLGRVIASDPPAAALRIGRFDGRLGVDLEVRGSTERVESELRDVEAITSVRISPSPVPAASPVLVPLPSYVRVRADRLDALVERTLDLLLEQARALPELTGAPQRSARERIERCQAMLRSLHGELMEMRLVPFDAVAHRLSRGIHDLAARLGKEIRLEIEGRDVRVDRSMLDALVEPLLHMARNAIDHGIEDGASRVAAGKEAAGRVTVALERRGDRLRVTVADDGRGLRPEKLRREAVASGLMAASEVSRLDDEQALMLATLPGLSTAPSLTDISGRGVGLDVARSAVESLGGRLTIRSEAGRGTRVVLSLPLTLALIPALLFRCRGGLYALPLTQVLRLVVLDGLGAAGIGASTHDVVRLDRRLGLGDPAAQERRAGNALLCPVGDRTLVLLVDEVIGRREVIVKPLQAPLAALREYSGAALLEDGSVALVLEPAALLPAEPAAARSSSSG